MKALTLPLLFLSLVLLSGCTTQQLSLTEHGEQFAPALGAEPSELKFLSYCDFRRVHRYKPLSNPRTQGIVALSDTHFYLMTDEVRRPNYTIEVPIKAMEGIAKLPSKFQLKYDGTVMEIRLNKTLSKQRNLERYNQVYRLFAQNSVPEIAAAAEFPTRRSSGSRWRNVSSSNGVGRYQGISRVGRGGTNNQNVYGTPYTPIQNRN